MELEEMMKITSLYRQMDQSLLMLQLASKPLYLLQINNHHSTIHGVSPILFCPKHMCQLLYAYFMFVLKFTDLPVTFDATIRISFKASVFALKK